MPIALSHSDFRRRVIKVTMSATIASRNHTRIITPLLTLLVFYCSDQNRSSGNLPLRQRAANGPARHWTLLLQSDISLSFRTMTGCHNLSPLSKTVTPYPQASQTKATCQSREEHAFSPIARIGALPGDARNKHIQPGEMGRKL